MPLINVLDLAFSPIPDVAWVERRRAEGVRAIFQDVWTGGYESNDKIQLVARANLEKIMLGGCIPCAYTNAAPWRTPIIWYNESQNNMGSMGQYVKHVMVDVEIAGIDPALVREFINMWKSTGYTVCTYSADWFVGFWKLQLGDASAVWNGEPYVQARYDGVPDLSTNPPVHPLGPLMGKQYLGSHIIEGVEVDASVMDAAFFGLGDELAQLTDRTIEGLNRVFGTSLADIWGRTPTVNVDHLFQPAGTDGAYYFEGRQDWTPAMAMEAFAIWGDYTHFGNFYKAFARLEAALAAGGDIPQPVLDAIEEIRINLQNPPLGAQAQAVLSALKAKL